MCAVCTHVLHILSKQKAKNNKECIETLSVAIGNLSCLDRMVDPGVRVVEEVDRGVPDDLHRHGTVSRGDTDRSSRKNSINR